MPERDPARQAGPTQRSLIRLPLFWVPENDGLWPHLTAAEHVRMVSGASADHGRCRELLAGFDLGDLAEIRPDRMSRGERSRLAVARALASEAAVLVMDEPLAHVDPARIGGYWDVLRNHCREQSVSFVFATHAPETALAEAEHVVCLHEGRVCWTGSVAALYHEPPSAELAAFLGPANWFEAEEAANWLDNPQPGRRCYRPEQIRIVARSSGRVVVNGSRFCGAYETVEVTDAARGAVSRLYHRPAAGRLREGERVIVEVIESDTARS